MSSKREVFALTFLCYTGVHALRTAYSQAKINIQKEIGVDSKIMGILDSLMLLFLGIGHFVHAISPIKRPVRSLWMAMIACSINYGLMPLILSFKPFCNIIYLSLFMVLNGFLQSYCWPTLLMIINSQYQSKENSTLIGFWSTNANFGNIIGYFVFQVMNFGWETTLVLIGSYALLNGLLTFRIKQIPIQNQSSDSQQSDSQTDPEPQTIITDQLTQSLVSENEKNEINENQKYKKFEQKEQKTHQKQKSSNESSMSNLSTLKDPKIILITTCFSLVKSIIYGIMLWLPLYFKTKEGFKEYASSIPITYDSWAICGSIFIGYLFIKIINKGLLMIPFMVVLVFCFFSLRFDNTGVLFVFIIIGIVGFCLGGIFNTLAGLIVVELTQATPDHLKSSRLTFYSAITMAAGNITTAATQVLIGFVIGKQHQQGIFLVFTIYSVICLICLIMIAIITIRRQSKSPPEVIKSGVSQQEDIQHKIEQSPALAASGNFHNHTQHKNRLLTKSKNYNTASDSDVTRCPSFHLQDSLIGNNSIVVSPYDISSHYK